MNGLTETIYQAAYQEVLRVRTLLQEQADCFNRTFTLSAEEIEQLDAHAELHVSGGAIELLVPNADIVFSLRYTTGRTPDQPTNYDREDGGLWELVAFQGLDSFGHRVCTLRVGPVSSEYTRRVRGARLVAAIGDYLDSLQADARAHVVGCMRMDSFPTWLPAIAAHSILQEA